MLSEWLRAAHTNDMSSVFGFSAKSVTIMFYHKHKLKDKSAQNSTVLTNVGITRVKNKIPFTIRPPVLIT